MKQTLSLIVFVFFTYSCGNNQTYSMKLNELHEFEIEPLPNTFKLNITVKGNSECPVSLSLFMDGVKFNYPYVFNGKIDTLIRRDWYGNNLSFEVNPIDCSKNIDVKVVLYQ